MHLRKPKAFGVINHHKGSIGHVHTRLNDGGAKEDIYLFIHHILPDIGKGVLIQFSVGNLNARRGKFPLQKGQGRLQFFNIIIQVKDYGKGIEDITKAKQPLYTSKSNLERSGMGFTVMESFMDNLNVRSKLGKGTTVIMRKKLS